MRRTRGPTRHGVMGRWAVFRDKSNGRRVQGVLTQEGAKNFELHRTALTLLYRSVLQREPTAVSDADTIEFLARGVHSTTRHLKETARMERAIGN